MIGYYAREANLYPYSSTNKLDDFALPMLLVRVRTTTERSWLWAWKIFVAARWGSSEKCNPNTCQGTSH